MYGSVELFWYVRRKQGTRFKYNGKFPADSPSDVFWFKSQNIDNFLRSFFISIPLWTLVEVLFLYAFAKGYVSWLTWADHPVYLAVLTLLVPAIHEVHFFCIHRLIHTPFLYKWVHSVHHNSINPSPWSSLSMHPVEGFLYHAVAFWHLIIPSNPIVALFQLHSAGVRCDQRPYWVRPAGDHGEHPAGQTRLLGQKRTTIGSLQLCSSTRRNAESWKTRSRSCEPPLVCLRLST